MAITHMEEETRIIFKGPLKDFRVWFEIMEKRYTNASIEAILQDFNTNE